MPAPDGEQRGSADDVGPHYLGLGCVTAVVGFAGGGMIAVLIAKIVGALTRCSSDAETGAPCNWFTYAVFGAIAGFVLVPIISIALRRRSRKRALNSERG